jgi:hypothetical protein
MNQQPQQANLLSDLYVPATDASDWESCEDVPQCTAENSM